jgi:hypothetical protein
MHMLFAHLLKWQFQPDHRSNSWKVTIVEQRYQIEQLLEMSPSLKHIVLNNIVRSAKLTVWQSPNAESEKTVILGKMPVKTGMNIF